MIRWARLLVVGKESSAGATATRDDDCGPGGDQCERGWGAFTCQLGGACGGGLFSTIPRTIVVASPVIVAVAIATAGEGSGRGHEDASSEG